MKKYIKCLDFEKWEGNRCNCIVGNKPKIEEKYFAKQIDYVSVTTRKYTHHFFL